MVPADHGPAHHPRTDSLFPLMEALAPAVIAVVVAHDPGPWFEEALASLGAQDYPELSVLVLDAGSADDLRERVASVLPAAFVRRFEENRGFGATADEVRSMVEGAAYYLFCHDDVALFPDTVHLMVEESFRSNAGVVSPKMVDWGDPSRLLHVGMTIDQGGSVVGRVHPHELDHGQHDAVRDAFVVPGGCTLVRADLYAEVGGFSPDIVAMGEDLDLCWRIQMAGARVIVAPEARVRHREELASGSRPVESGLVGGGPSDRVPTLQELQRRHELLAILKCTGRFHLLRVLPQIALLALGEVFVAALAGNRRRTRAVTQAWRWNLSRLKVTREERKQVQGARRVSDKELRPLQLGGSARLTAYVRRVFQHGFHGAHSHDLYAAGGPHATGFEGGDLAVADGVELEPAYADRLPLAGPEEAPANGSGRGRAVAWVLTAVMLLIGTRDILGGTIPSIGQFAPLPNWTSTFTQFAAGWHPSGVGTTAPASPAFALIGLVGTVLIGAMGLTQKVLIFACIPLGAWGASRLVRPFGSPRAALTAGVVYLAIPLPYDALALGRWGALITYAGFPWVLRSLFRATALVPFASPGQRRSRRRGRAGAGVRQGDDETAHLLSGWAVRRILLLGLLEAVLVSFVPAAAIAVVLAAVAVTLSSAFLGYWRSASRSLLVALGATVVAGVLCLPWVIGTARAGSGALAVFGVATPVSEAASWSDLLRFALGPIGVSPLAWGFVVAALLPLVLGRGPRFHWAARLWSIALASWFLDWLVGRGKVGDLAIDPLVLLAPAAVAVAACVGLGLAAFETDLRTAVFGWRQLATVVAAAAVVAGTLPTFVSALPGRWELPQDGFDQSLTWMPAKASAGTFRVLWLGDARSLPQGSWKVGNGLAYATSVDGPPDAAWLWNAADAGPASSLASAVDQASSSRTNQLGRLLAPAGVRYVVAVTAVAPVIPGLQTPEQYPVPAGLLPALSSQLDLVPVVSEGGVTVYENADWLPVRAEVAAHSNDATGARAGTTPSPAGTSSPSPGTPVAPDPLTPPAGNRVVAGAQPVLPGGPTSRSFTGAVRAGTVLASLAPADRWRVATSHGSTVRALAPAFGWVGRSQVSHAATVTLRFDGDAWVPLGVAFQIAAWVVALALLAARRRPARARRRGHGTATGPGGARGAARREAAGQGAAGQSTAGQEVGA